MRGVYWTVFLVAVVLAAVSGGCPITGSMWSDS